MDKRLIIIDGNSIINRAFYALPDMSNSDGLKTNAIFGFVRMMFKIIEDYQPTHMSVAFDKKDDRGLAQKLTETFEEMREDGTMKEIVGTYMEDTDCYLEVRTDET